MCFSLSPSWPWRQPQLHLLLVLQAGTWWHSHSGRRPQVGAGGRGGAAWHSSAGMDHPVSTVAASVERGGSDLAGLRGGGDGDMVEGWLGFGELHSTVRAQFDLRWESQEKSLVQQWEGLQASNILLCLTGRVVVLRGQSAVCHFLEWWESHKAASSHRNRTTMGKKIQREIIAKCHCWKYSILLNFTALSQFIHLFNYPSNFYIHFLFTSSFYTF